MGFIIGRRFSVGGGKTDLLKQKRIRLAEIVVNGRGKFLIREDGKKLFSAVPCNDERGPAIVQGDSTLDAAEKLDLHLRAPL